VAGHRIRAEQADPPRVFEYVGDGRRP
jgi:hypothetical protein